MWGELITNIIELRQKHRQVVLWIWRIMDGELKLISASMESNSNLIFGLILN